MGHTHRCLLVLKKKKKKKSHSPESRVPELGSDPPIGSDRDSGRDRRDFNLDRDLIRLECVIPS